MLGTNEAAHKELGRRELGAVERGDAEQMDDGFADEGCSVGRREWSRSMRMESS